MVHIGIDARLNYYRHGGIPTYTTAMIQEFAKLRTHHRMTILKNRRMAETISTLDEYRVITPPHHRIERTLLSLELMPLKLDILHCPDFIPPRFGAKYYVITVHDLTFIHFPEHKDAASLRYYRDQINLAVRKADIILAVSEATKSDLIDILHVPAGKIIVQPHGVGKQYRQMTKAELQPHRQLLDLPANFILFVGTIEPRKNIPILLDAYANLPKATKDHFPLVLVGQIGWKHELILEKITQMKNDGINIHLRHNVTNAQLPALYNLASLCVLPSQYEGFGLPMLEAMACGTPVIASDNSSLPEVIGDAGLLVSTGDPAALANAIEHTLNDTEWRFSASRRGLDRAKQFTWRKSAEIALQAYDRLGDS